MRDPIRRENLLIPSVVTALGLFRVLLQIAIGGTWGADATFGVVILIVGLAAFAAELRRASGST